MPRLYKFDCKPNYPVLTRATLLFWVPDDNVLLVEPMAKELAKDNGIVNSYENETKLTYLGEFSPSKEQLANNSTVLLAINGEY